MVLRNEELSQVKRIAKNRRRIMANVETFTKMRRKIKEDFVTKSKFINQHIK